MSQTAIGKAALILTTDATQAKAGLTDFGGQAKKLAADAAAKVGEGAGSGGLLGKLVGAAGPVGAALGAGISMVGGFVEQQTQRIKDLAKVGRQADAVGVASDQYMGLSAALKRVGVEGDQVNTVFARLGHFTQGAAEGNTASAAALERLGLSAGDLAKVPLDQQLLQISTAIAKLPPGAAQASAAMEIFGRGGHQLLPILQQGGDKLQAFVDKQKALGAAVDPAGMKAVQAAAAALPKMQAAWDGLANRVTVAVAPAFQVVFELLSEGFELAMPIFRAVGEYWETWGTIATAVAKEVVGQVRWIVSSVQEWLASLSDVKVEFPTVREIVVAVFRAIGTTAALAWDVIKLGAGAVAVVFGKLVEQGVSVISLFRAVVDLGRDLPDYLKPDGFDGFADSVARVDERVRGLGRDAAAWGAGAVGSFGRSAVEFNAWLDRVMEAGREKVEEAKAEALAATEAVTTAVAMTSAKTDNAALAKGSSAEVTARLRYEMGGKLADQQLAEQRKANTILGQIKDAVEHHAMPAFEALLPL